MAFRCVIAPVRLPTWRGALRLRLTRASPRASCVFRCVLFICGQLTRLAERAGGGAMARAASGRVLDALAEAYGRMLFTPGPFQADPHPGASLPRRVLRHAGAAR